MLSGVKELLVGVLIHFFPGLQLFLFVAHLSHTSSLASLIRALSPLCASPHLTPLPGFAISLTPLLSSLLFFSSHRLLSFPAFALPPLTGLLLCYLSLPAFSLPPLSSGSSLPFPSPAQPSLHFPPFLPPLLSPRSGENRHHNLILFVLLSS